MGGGHAKLKGWPVGVLFWSFYLGLRRYLLLAALYGSRKGSTQPPGWYLQGLATRPAHAAELASRAFDRTQP
eukprot:145573-Chlamydomonas_euryale.AAC.14